MKKKIITALLSSILFLQTSTFSVANETGNIALQYAYNNQLAQLTSLDASKLHVQDQYGFTLLDYAKVSKNKEMIEWVKKQKIRSGVDKHLVKRMQIWLHVLNLPVDNMVGIYNQKIRKNIMNFQHTRGIPSNPFITPEWFYLLEEEALLSIQSKLRATGYDAPLNGLLDRDTVNAFETLVVHNKGKLYPLFSSENLSYLQGIPKPLYPPTLSFSQFPPKEKHKTSTPEDTDSTIDVVELEPGIIDPVEIQVPSRSKTTVEKSVEDPQESVQYEQLFNYPRETIFNIVNTARSKKVLSIQVRLKILGFFPDELDGSMGPITQHAIKEYQKSLGHSPKGILSASWEGPLKNEIYRKVQEKLKALGYYDAEVDGIHGLSTAQSITKYKSDKQLNYQDELAPAFLLALFSEKTRKLEPSSPAKIDEIKPVETVALTTTDDAIEVSTDKAETSAETQTTPESTERPVRLTFVPNELPNRTYVQLSLGYLGYFHGTANGLNSTELTDAVKDFQTEHNLSVTGIIDMQTRKQISTSTIIKFQQYLQTSGYMDDQPTGTLGPKTSRAIQVMKQKQNIPIDRKMDIPFILLLIDKIQDTEYLDNYLAFVEKERKSLASQPVKLKDYIPNKNTEATTDQLMLAYLGYFNSTVDGVIGDDTTEAVKLLQRAYQLNIDGQLGQSTRRILTREAINKFQRYLKAENHMEDNPTGTLGPKTRNAITKLKAKHKLTDNHEFDDELLLVLIDAESNSNFIEQKYRPFLESIQKEKERILLVQKYLIGLEILGGKADGISGPATNTAIEKFRKNHKLAKGNEIDEKLLKSLSDASIKKGQEYLKTLGYKITVDGAWGGQTQQALNRFLEKIKKPKSDKITADILLQMKHAASKVIVNKAPKTTIASTPQARKAAMPNLKNTAKQVSGVLSAAPTRNTISGKMQLVHNNQKGIVGCKVGSISMDGHWCTGRKSGEQCTVRHRNKKVISLRCK